MPPITCCCRFPMAKLLSLSAGPGPKEAGHAQAEEGARQAEERAAGQRASGRGAGGLQRDDRRQGGPLRRRQNVKKKAAASRRRAHCRARVMRRVGRTWWFRVSWNSIEMLIIFQACTLLDVVSAVVFKCDRSYPVTWVVVNCIYKYIPTCFRYRKLIVKVGWPAGDQAEPGWGQSGVRSVCAGKTRTLLGTG